ncbi:hypothetical protein BH09BAC2_BH09BAC2_15740 [soil metagenome]
MFKSLTHININWFAFLGISFIFLLIPGITVFSFLAFTISLYQFFLLFYSANHIIPVRYIFGALMCLQFLIGPGLAYNGFDEYQYFVYKMQIPEVEYFSYALPAVVVFILGLNYLSDLKGEYINGQAIEKFTLGRPNFPYIMIGIGFFSSFIAGFFSSDLAFIFYLISGFKFVGFFWLILSTRRIKPLPLVVVYGSVISSSLVNGMFHDLITWVIFLGFIYAYRYKPNTAVKASLTALFVLILIGIQLSKNSYRGAITEGKEAGIETLSEAYQERNTNTNEFFSAANLAPSIVRINQGFILTNIIKNVPKRVPFSNGDEMKQILDAAILPRILAPDKLKAGDKTIFIKFSGIQIRDNTSMALGSLGDAYLNFGIFGGCIFMFLYGLLFNFVLKRFYKFSKYSPVLLLFTPLVFYYPIRPDCELQTILGHLVKSCFLIAVVFFIWKSKFQNITSRTVVAH